MIYTITINPCLDVIKKVDEIRIGTTYIPTVNEISNAGGKSIIVSRAITALNIPNIALGFIGGYIGEKIKALLDAEDVRTDFIEINNESRVNVILIDKNKNEYRFNSNGPDINNSDLDKLYTKIENLPAEGPLSPKFATIGSLSGVGNLKDKIYFYKKIVKILKEKECTMALDTRNSEILNEFLDYIDIIKANLYEFNEIIGKKLVTEKDTHSDIYKKSEEEFLNWKFINEKNKNKNENWQLLINVLKNFKIKNKNLSLILSLGPKGMLFAPKNNNSIMLLYYPEDKIEYIDYKKLVGVGDSALAGYIVGLYKYKTEIKAVIHSIATATARIMTKDNENKFLDSEKVNEIYNEIYNNSNSFILYYKYNDDKIKYPF